jgi:large subunit ribosomal protein L19
MAWVCAKVPQHMAVITSTVDMEARKKLDIRPGDTVRVWQRIEEKGKFRLQAFEGLVLARKHGKEAGGTFTVRRVASGVGVEKIFPLYTPMIDKVEIVKRATVRRAKLYFIREKVAREARRMLRRTRLMSTGEKAAADVPVVEEPVAVAEETPAQAE